MDRPSSLLGDAVVQESDRGQLFLFLEQFGARPHTLLSKGVVAQIHRSESRRRQALAENLHRLERFDFRSTGNSIAEIDFFQRRRKVNERTARHLGRVDTETLRAKSHLGIRRALFQQRSQDLLRALLRVKLAILARFRHVKLITIHLSVLNSAISRRSGALHRFLHEFGCFFHIQSHDFDQRSIPARRRARHLSRTERALLDLFSLGPRARARARAVTVKSNRKKRRFHPRDQVLALLSSDRENHVGGVCGWIITSSSSSKTVDSIGSGVEIQMRTRVVVTREYDVACVRACVGARVAICRVGSKP